MLPEPASRDELEYVTGGELCLRRERRGRAVVIVDAAGVPVTGSATLARIRALTIPPAWTDVWIATSPAAHLQATGLDAKGRRQYLYHPMWRARRDAEKFDDMLAFSERLPSLRAVAKAFLDSGDSPRDSALALAVRLLDIGFFRVGWDRYARDNGHVGLTTLRREHVSLRGAEVQFDFIAKSGKRRRMTVKDPQSVDALRALKRRRGPPPELLAYRSPLGEHRVHAPDVNNALRAWAQGPYSAKEFRTWAATVLAAVALARQEALGQRGPRAISQAVREVSSALGNTPTVARKSYIDPRVIERFEAGTVIELPPGAPGGALPVHIQATDHGVLIELPTEVDGDSARLGIEQRVRDLLRAA